MTGEGQSRWRWGPGTEEEARAAYIGLQSATGGFVYPPVRISTTGEWVILRHTWPGPPPVEWKRMSELELRQAAYRAIARADGEEARRQLQEQRRQTRRAVCTSAEPEPEPEPGKARPIQSRLFGL